MQGRLGIGQRRLQSRQFLARQVGHLGIVQHFARIGHVALQLAVPGDLFDHEAQIGIFLGQCRNIATTRGHRSFEVFKPLGDLLKAF